MVGIPQYMMLKNMVGIYLPYLKKIVYDHSNHYYREGYRTHERTHSALPNPQEKAIKYIMQGTNGKYNDSYYDDPKEIYARMMDFRKTNNLDPNKKYTADELKSIDKAVPRTRFEPVDFKLTDRYDDNTLERLFNDIAQNKSENSNIQYVKKGGYLNKYK